MPTNKANIHTQLNNDKFRASDINLKAQLLRIQAIACAKEINSIWYLDQSKICQFFQTYAKLPQSKIQASVLFEMEGTRMIKSQNKIYLGQVRNKKKHGLGIVIYRDGRIYEGEFYENQKCGQGVELYSNGNLYVGTFSQNKKHGKGSFYWFSLCPPACTKNAGINIEQYHGDWWGGLPDGAGQHQKLNGDYYVGGFKNGLKHGQGVENYANKDAYKGEFINGLAEGYGEYKWADGSIYKGDFKQGYRNGYGIWQSQSGKQQYKGHYLLDRKHGYGIYDWGNGTVYKGNYLEDVRTGYGELYKNGEKVYEGQWNNGQELKLKQDTTPPKNKINSMTVTSRKQMSSTAAGITTPGSFRVKTTKNYSTTLKDRKMSAKSTTKKNNFLINFRVADGRNSTHRNCQACCRRPSTVQLSHKFQRSHVQYLNPQQYN